MYFHSVEASLHVNGLPPAADTAAAHAWLVAAEAFQNATTSDMLPVSCGHGSVSGGKLLLRTDSQLIAIGKE